MEQEYEPISTEIVKRFFSKEADDVFKNVENIALCRFMIIDSQRILLFQTEEQMLAYATSSAAKTLKLMYKGIFSKGLAKQKALYSNITIHNG